MVPDQSASKETASALVLFLKLTPEHQLEILAMIKKIALQQESPAASHDQEG